MIQKPTFILNFHSTKALPEQIQPQTFAKEDIHAQKSFSVCLINNIHKHDIAQACSQFDMQKKDEMQQSIIILVNKIRACTSMIKM